MKAPIKKHVAPADQEPTVELEPENRPARERGKSVDKADPFPGLGRRVLYASKLET